MTTLNVRTIDVTPDADPFSNGSPTVTELSLDCRDGGLFVTQQMRTNSTPMDEYHGHVQTWNFNGNINEKSVREFIEKRKDVFQAIIDGYEETWNGSNMVASFSEEARKVIDSIEFFLSKMVWDDYQVWDVEDWCYGEVIDMIHHTTTDAELTEIVDECTQQPDVIILGDILEYLTTCRNEQRDEFEYETAQ